MMDDTNDTNDTNGKTWTRSEFGETFHSFSPSGTAICRKNIRWSYYASVHPEYLRTEAEVNRVVGASLGYRKCVNCATKEQQHRDRSAASMAPVNPLDQVCEGVLPEETKTVEVEETKTVESPAEVVDMDDLHTQALVEDFQRRMRAVVRNVNATITGANLAESLHLAAQSLRELADMLAGYREPVRTEFADADDALEYLSEHVWEPTPENPVRGPGTAVTVRVVYAPSPDAPASAMSVGYDINEWDSLRGCLVTTASACYLDRFLTWYRPVQDTTN